MEIDATDAMLATLASFANIFAEKMIMQILLQNYDGSRYCAANPGSGISEAIACAEGIVVVFGKGFGR